MPNRRIVSKPLDGLLAAQVLEAQQQAMEVAAAVMSQGQSGADTFQLNVASDVKSVAKDGSKAWRSRKRKA